MKTYIYPENLRATVKLWFWNVRDFVGCGSGKPVECPAFCGDCLLCFSLASG